MKQDKNIELVVIDYLQLITGSEERTNRSRREEITEVTLKLKKLSEKLNIPIITTFSLSSIPNRRDDHKPRITDIKYPETVVEIADAIMFLYRDDYYNPYSEYRNIAEIEVAKNKYGSTGTVELLWLGLFVKFANIAKKDDDNIQNEEKYRLRQKFKNIDEIKKSENMLSSINNVKQIEKNYRNEEEYILLNNGDLYIDGSLKDNNVEELFSLDGNIDIYRIKKDNTIIPMKEKTEWNDLDVYLYNNAKPYKKILTHGSAIIGLTQENRVVSISFWEFLGIIPENFIDVDDIFINEQGKHYIIKENKEMPLYVNKYYEEE